MVRRSLRELLATAASARADAAAILAPACSPMTYGMLVGQLDRVAAALRGRIGPDDRVAIIAPDSARTAVAMLAVMSCATLTPLDSRLTRDELARQLARLKTTLVLVDSASPESVTLAAADAGLPVATIVADAADSISFSLHGLDASPTSRAVADAPRGGADLAIVLCTSGTTGQPKLVPLTHDNLLSMMVANVGVLDLTPADRCLGVMALCHIHGLGAVICSLLGGGSIAVLPGFSTEAFYAGLTAFAPTWYTSVPTIHATVLDHAAAHADVIAKARLRMIRSGSAPMPVGIPERLESTFGAIYVEALGATEGSAYFCSNRPATRRIGSVGQAMPGNDLRVINAAGKFVRPGVTGELVARGPGVFAGYEADDASTRAAFTADGYFRSGDLARIDADGFVFIGGRLKEQINRGGSKVSPAEVEAALLAHPAIAKAAAFGIADERVGQEVGAIVVCHSGATCTPIELQRHAAAHLAEYKVPRHIIVADAIPVGPRGKIERLRLAETIGLERFTRIGRGYAPPTTAIEQTLAAIWSDVLGSDVLDIGAPFFALGGDSTQALRVCLSIERQYGRPVPLAAIGAYPTIRALAAMLEGDGWQAEPAAPITLREGAPGGPTLFVLPGVGGNIFNYHPLARHLPADVRVVGLPLPGADGLEPPPTSMDAIVDRYVAHMRHVAPGEAFAMAGYSFGGRVGFEVGRRLIAEGDRVAFVALLDVRGPNWPPPKRFTRFAQQLRAANPFRRSPRGADRSAAEIIDEMVAPAGLPEAMRERQRAMSTACEAISQAWQPTPVDGVEVRLFRAVVPIWNTCDLSDRAMGWGELTRDAVEVIDAPGSHITMLHEPHVAALATRLGEAIMQPAS